MPEPATPTPLPRPTFILIQLVVLCGFGSSGTAQESRRTKPDPFDGMDRNGRIPKAELPADIGHPERWRYIPPARLMEGNVFERFLVSSFFSPIIFREEDVGTGGGVVITDLDFRNQRRQEFANIIVTYSSEGQQNYRMNWRRWTNHIDLAGGGVMQDERSFMHLGGGFNKSLTARYYGLGPERQENAESSYTRERSALDFRYQFTEPGPADDLILSVGLLAEHNSLSSGRVTSALNTRVAYAGDYTAGDDHDMLWLNVSARFDTRDSVHNPYSGYYVGAGISAALAQTGGDAGAVFSLSGSKVFTVPPLFHTGGDGDEEHPPTDSFAVGAFTQVTSGDLPFYSLPSLGGSRTLRGYINNRWTDRTAWHAATEYRFWTMPRGFALTDWVRVERLGLALFYELGSVAPTWTALFDDKAKYSYGVSFRLSLERTALFRFDLGFSDEDTNLSIAYGLTF